MSISKKTFKTIDEYIALFPNDVQNILKALRKAIKDVAPQAEETISYKIPTYKLNGNLVHFAAFKDHVSFFPTSSGVEAFKEKLNSYKTSKGTIRFPLDEPIPFDLIKEIVKFRVKENLSKNNSNSKV